MRIKLTFLGAARNVTGSRYLIEANDLRFLVDCGIFQEWALKKRNWDPMPVPPQDLDAILLTHAHLDHSGLIPRLVNQGFHGRIYCTDATAEIARIMLLDAAHLLQEDAEFKRKRHQREGRKAPFPEMPLYTVEDANAAFKLFSPVSYGETTEIGKGIKVSFHDAGHVLGSAMIKVRIQQKGAERTVLFSGDIGRWDKPILHDPTLFKQADYVLVESTYGDRVHDPMQHDVDAFAEAIDSTAKAGGNVIIPSFALERAQEIMYYLNQLLNENRIPHLMTFIDSPMAINVTKVFEQHHELFDKEMLKLIHQNHSPFQLPGLHMVTTADESKAINHIAGTVIILAGSGMCTGGRIKHHLVANISRPDSTIIFVGYQASGTLGREIVDGAKKVRILGQQYPVRARVVYLNGFSSHADRTQLMKWLSALKDPPRLLFVTHGDPDVTQHFAELVKTEKGWKVTAPEYQESFVLE